MLSVRFFFRRIFHRELPIRQYVNECYVWSLRCDYEVRWNVLRTAVTNYVNDIVIPSLLLIVTRDGNENRRARIPTCNGAQNIVLKPFVRVIYYFIFLSLSKKWKLKRLSSIRFWNLWFVFCSRVHYCNITCT